MGKKQVAWPFPAAETGEADSCGVRVVSLASGLRTPQLRPRPAPGPAPLPACPAPPLSLHAPPFQPALSHCGIPWRAPRYLLSAPWEEDEIRRDRVEPQSVSLSWREPIPVGAPGANGTEYEIRYYEKVRRGMGGTWGWVLGLWSVSLQLLPYLPSRHRSLLYFLREHIHDLLRPEFLPVPSTPCLDPRAPPQPPLSAWTPGLLHSPRSLLPHQSSAPLSPLLPGVCN